MSKAEKLSAVSPQFHAANRTVTSREVTAEPIQRPQPRRVDPVSPADPTDITPVKKRPAPTVVEPSTNGEGESAAAPSGVGEERWRSFVAPHAERGEARRNRLNIPVPEEAIRALNRCNYVLGQEKSRWRVNRSLLLEKAIELVEDNVDFWMDEFRRQRNETGVRTKNFAARIDDDHFERVNLLRLTPDGERQIGPVLGVAVAHLLDDGKTTNFRPGSSVQSGQS